MVTVIIILACLLGITIGSVVYLELMVRDMSAILDHFLKALSELALGMDCMQNQLDTLEGKLSQGPSSDAMGEAVVTDAEI